VGARLGIYVFYDESVEGFVSYELDERTGVGWDERDTYVLSWCYKQA